jgi:dihydroxyacetone kinase phosphoprotein-dependent L subunit
MDRNAAVVRLCLDKALAAIAEHEEELGRLDAAAGDGDHGAGMVRGLRAAVSAADGETARQVLISAGAAFSDAAGGASGALVGMLLTTIGNNLLDGVIDTVALYHALQAGYDALRKLGKAQPGDKTLLDTLAPFLKAFEDAANRNSPLTETWRTALPAAEQGARSTSEMISKKGRAARLGERSRGHLDPGAMSMFYMLRAAGEGLSEACPVDSQSEAPSDKV